MFGYVIERSGVSWNERFWFNIPALNKKGFGSDDRASVYASIAEAEEAISLIDKEFGFHCYITARAELYPPTM